MGAYSLFHCGWYCCISLLLKENKHNIYWLLGVLIVFSIKNAFNHFNITLMQYYFNDLLAMPAMLAYINLVLKFFGRKSVVHFKIIVLITAICGFMWEIVAIYIKPTSTYDVVDLCCYLIGAAIYMLSTKNEKAGS